MVRYGVLVVSHGSRSREWVRLVDEAIAGVKVPDGVVLFGAFLELVEGRLIQDGIDWLERQGATDLLVVPLFVSSGSTHVDEIAYALGVKPEPEADTGLAPFRVNARVHFGTPIDDDPEIADIIRDKIGPLSVDPEREAVLLVGHGSAERGFDRRWRNGLARLAERVRELGGFAAAEAATLLPDRIPCGMERLRRRHPDCSVIVAPLFLSEGYFTHTVIPSRLAPYPHRYAECALLPHPFVTRWLERQIAKLLARAESGPARDEPPGV